VLSPELTELLDATGSPDDAAKAIARDEELLAEAKAALPALRVVAEAKAGRDGVKAVVGKRLVLYPQPARTEGEWDAWWSDYFDALSDITLASLEAGMRAYVADPSSEFMPKPGRLRELAFTAPCRSLGRVYRIKRAIEFAEEKPAITGPRIDPNDVRAMVEDFSQRICAEREKPRLPSIAGRTDDGGLTAEMRSLLAQRQGQRA
jgi:hypothetical protein